MNCALCGKKLVGRWQKKFCSQKCAKMAQRGENHWNWKGGIQVNNPIGYRKRKRQEWGEQNKDKIKIYKQLYYCRRKAVGWPTIEDIQTTYENNIKKYGTLTCYLCKKPIEFGKDSIDHILPIFRGGTNEISNLAIAHGNCNSRKNKKTLKEYRKMGVTG